jgi:hypothetical protein
MRVVATKKSLRQVLRWTQRVLFAAAVVMLGYCGFVLANAWILQKRTSQEFERRLLDGARPARRITHQVPVSRSAGGDGLTSDRPH